MHFSGVARNGECRVFSTIVVAGLPTAPQQQRVARSAEGCCFRDLRSWAWRSQETGHNKGSCFVLFALLVAMATVTRVAPGDVVLETFGRGRGAVR